MWNDASLFPRLAPYVAWFALVLALSATGAVIVERASFGLGQIRRRRFESRYQPLVERAVAGDPLARDALVTSPPQYRVEIAGLLITPLIEDRDPRRIARTRAVVESMSLIPGIERYLESRLWWRRAIGLRAAGLLQLHEHTARIVAALDDRNDDVRAAALDALTDSRDPASLPAIVVRLLDPSLHRGRRLAALAAFGADAEPLLLDIADADVAHRVHYARAIALCGTDRSRVVLCRWMNDPRPDVRAAAFEALAHVGLDDRAASLAIGALNGDEPGVRAAAAHALNGWTGPGDAAAHLAHHLDDAWTVAVPAARSLQSMVPAGWEALRACAPRDDLAGLLARQMLWEAHAAC
jgi:hypothetical protein